VYYQPVALLTTLTLTAISGNCAKEDKN